MKNDGCDRIVVEKLSVAIELLTPTYIGGAKQYPEIRAPSVKGLLRYWYRALNPNYREDEMIIFGDTNTGISSFKLQIQGASQNRTCYLGRKPQSSHSPECTRSFQRLYGLKYLTFPFQRPKSAREAITPRQGIIFEHVFSSTILKSHNWEKIRRALIASWWGLAVFGGIGARSRRGLGSFMIVNVECNWPEAEILSELKEQGSVADWARSFEKSLSKIQEYFTTNHTNDHLTISDGTQVCLIGDTENEEHKGFDRWDDALDHFGKKLKEFRDDLSYGEKASFGLPIVGEGLEVRGKNHERGASPLLVRVVRIDVKYYLLMTLTNSPVLPPNEILTINKYTESTINRSGVEEFYEMASSKAIWRKTL